MAVLKHMASKNPHMHDMIAYLEYEHEPGTKKVVWNEFGNPKLREGMIIEGIGCTPENFETECIRVNDMFGKNRSKDEIKFHSYIISFDPRDAEDHGLTKEQVQEFGKEYALKYFPGHQTVVCTHSDGNNGSGNLHCHIVINSLRYEDVSPQPFMERPIDSKAGYKHHLTNDFENVLKQGVMEMCFERGLYQVNLLEPARIKVTDKEYFAERKGMSKEGAAFETKKNFLRNAIEKCASEAQDIDRYRALMEEKFGITVKESRGRMSYLIPGRDKPMTGRILGSQYVDDFVKMAVLGKAEFSHEVHYYSYKTSDYVPFSVKKLVDIAANEKAQSSKGYEHAVKISNLKKSAATFNYLSENNVKSLSELDLSIERISERLKENEAELERLSDTRDCPMPYRERFAKMNPLIEENTKIRKDLKDLQNARYNLGLMLNGSGETPARKSAAKDKER